MIRQPHGGDLYPLAKLVGCREDELTDFSVNLNPLGISPKARAVLADGFAAAGRYPDPSGTPLRLAIAARYNLDPDRIVVGNGSTQLIHLIPRALGSRRVLIPAPTFLEYERAARAAGVMIEFVRLKAADGFRVESEALVRRLRRGFDLLVLCNPNNPTGDLMAKKDVLELVEAARATRTTIVVDEAYMDYAESESLLPEVCGHRHLIVIRSFTKFYALAGLRAGYLVADSRLARRIQITLPPWSVNTLAQAAAIESLTDEAYIAESRQALPAMRDCLAGAMSRLPACEPLPSAANFILVRLRRGLTGPKLFQHLLRHRLVVRLGGTFRGLGDGYVRIAVKRPEETARLAQACETL